MDDYTQDDFEADCADGKMRQVTSHQRYKDFYEAAPKILANVSLGRLSFVKPHGLTLDLGCHDGQGIKEFYKGCRHIVGVDVAFSALQVCKQRLDTMGLRASLIQSWAESCPFKNNVFDSVVLTEVLEHVINPEPVMAEVGRILKPKDGRLFITSPPIRRGNFAHVRGVSRKAMESLLVGAGLEPLAWANLSQYTAVTARKP